MLSAISLVFFAILYTSNGDSGYLPSYIKPCDFNSAISKCVKDQMEAILPYFTKGIPELNVPSLEPINLDDIHLDGNGLKLTFTEATMEGINTVKISSFKLDIGKNEETISLKMKVNLDLIAKYEVDGRILILPIQGKGDAKVINKNVDVQIDSKLSHVKDAKGTHFKLVSPDYKYNIGNTKFQLQNLFNGNKQLSDATHQFLNENWQQVMDELAPPAIKQIVKSFVKAINRFLASVTIKQIVRGYVDD